MSSIFNNRLEDASFGLKLFAFVCLIIMGYCLMVVIAVLCGLFIGEDGLVRITIVVQDIILFILPALCAASLFDKTALHYLCARHVPNADQVFLVIVCIIFSMPFMNYVVAWNEAIELPSALAAVETWMREQEDAAMAATREMLKMSSFGDFILMILIVGVMTGIGEEFVFRGVLQRLFVEKFHNHHIAVWVTAIIFSAIHLQFYGFVPRMLLGAFFGYLLIWSGNIWLPVIAHALNNSIAVVGAYIYGVEPMDEAYIEQMGTQGDWWTLLPSLFITIALIFFTRRTLLVGKMRRKIIDDLN